MSYQDWLKCVRDFEGDVTSNLCPKCGKNSIKFQFVGDKSTRFGNLYLWCDSCKHGIHVSSVKLPKNVDVIPYGLPDSEFKMRIPEYKLIN
jgi:predicted RNA-binding Zn-ribbon protein involved in translation (DUF1610 family)